MNVAIDRRINTSTIFTDNVGVQRDLINTNNMTAWWLNHRVSNIKRLLNIAQVNIEVILMEWNGLADKLAAHGTSRHGISLFHQGLDLPRWLMKWLRKNNYRFV